MAPYSLKQLYEAYSAYSKEVVLYLPRTSDLNQLAAYAHRGNPGQQIDVKHYCMYGASKAVCAFYGEFGDLNGEND